MKKIFSNILCASLIFTSVNSFASQAFQCSQVFSEISSPPGTRAADVVSLLNAPRNSRSAEDFSKTVESLRSAEELHSFILEMKVAYPRQIHRSWGLFLQKINLAQVLERLIKDSPSDPQLRYLQETLRAFNREVVLDGWTYPLLLVFEPHRILEFVNNIEQVSGPDHQSFQAAAGGTDRLSLVNSSLSYAFANMSPVTKKQVLEKVHQEISKIDLNNEQLEMREGRLHQPASRGYRRNLEVILRMALAPELKQLEKDMRRLQDPKQALDKYFDTIYRVVGPKRGGYSSQKVIDAAQILQKHFSKYFKNENHYVEMYGSFVNGKAAFKTSDVDMKVSESLFLDLFERSYSEVNGQIFELYFANFMKAQKDQAPPSLKLFWESYQKAEIEIAEKVFQRAPQHPSEMLAMLYPPVPFKNEPNDSRWYNPITIRIYRNKIEIHISDFISTHERKYFKEI